MSQSEWMATIPEVQVQRYQTEVYPLKREQAMEHSKANV